MTEKSGILYGTVLTLTSFQNILDAVTMGSHELQDAEASNGLKRKGKTNENTLGLGRIIVSVLLTF
jgi:hypothetical protein